jgi:ElaB/YqjD/DUF883 family membrane-anchored ribosome-binding protein
MVSEADTLRKDVDELKAALNNVAKDVSKLGKTYAAEQASKVREGAYELGEKGQQSAEALGNVVREHPLQSLLVSFGVGVIVSQLIRKR